MPQPPTYPIVSRHVTPSPKLTTITLHLVAFQALSRFPRSPSTCEMHVRALVTPSSLLSRHGKYKQENDIRAKLKSMAGSGRYVPHLHTDLEFTKMYIEHLHRNSIMPTPTKTESPKQAKRSSPPSPPTPPPPPPPHTSNTAPQDRNRSKPGTHRTA